MSAPWADERGEDERDDEDDGEEDLLDEADDSQTSRGNCSTITAKDSILVHPG